MLILAFRAYFILYNGTWNFDFDFNFELDFDFFLNYTGNGPGKLIVTERAEVYCTEVYCTEVYCTEVYCTQVYCNEVYCTESLLPCHSLNKGPYVVSCQVAESFNI